MRKIKTAGTTKTLGHPNGNPEQSLPYEEGVGPDGEHVFITYWRPTFEELQQLAAGAVVALCVHGGGHPPVSIGVSAQQEVGD